MVLPVLPILGIAFVILVLQIECHIGPPDPIVLGTTSVFVAGVVPYEFHRDHSNVGDYDQDWSYGWDGDRWLSLLLYWDSWSYPWLPLHDSSEYGSSDVPFGCVDVDWYGVVVVLQELPSSSMRNSVGTVGSEPPW